MTIEYNLSGEQVPLSVDGLAFQTMALVSLFGRVNGKCVVLDDRVEGTGRHRARVQNFAIPGEKDLEVLAEYANILELKVSWTRDFILDAKEQLARLRKEQKSLDNKVSVEKEEPPGSMGAEPAPGGGGRIKMMDLEKGDMIYDPLSGVPVWVESILPAGDGRFDVGWVSMDGTDEKGCLSGCTGGASFSRFTAPAPGPSQTP